MDTPTACDECPRKNVLASKTVWFNSVFAAVVEVVPPAARWVTSHPQSAILIMAAGNYILRHFSEGGLRYGFKKAP